MPPLLSPFHPSTHLVSPQSPHFAVGACPSDCTVYDRITDLSLPRCLRRSAAREADTGARRRRFAAILSLVVISLPYRTPNPAADTYPVDSDI